MFRIVWSHVMLGRQSRVMLDIGVRKLRPQVVPHDLVSGSVQDANLRSSDYQNPLPDSAGHDRTLRLTSAYTSQRSVLVPDVSGCSG